MSLIKDVECLKTTPTPEIKTQLAEKVSYYYGQELFDDKDMKIAVEVIRLLAQDAEIHIRTILANNLKHSNILPRDIALRLANDLSAVSAPILKYSVVLTQDDLIEIVRSAKEVAALVAIAERTDVSQPLSEALINTNEEKVVESLSANRNADISEESLHKILTSFSRSHTITKALVERGNLPVVIVERLIQQVSNDLKRRLIQEYELPYKVVDELTTDSREQATLYLLSNNDHLHQTECLVEHLYQNKKLSNSIILRALCKGDLPFFEMGLAKLAGFSYSQAHDLLWKQGPAGFASLYKKANMPKGTFNAVNVIVQFALQEVKEGKVGDDNYSKHMIDRITESGYDKKISIMEYFMVLMKSKVNALDVVRIEQ